ncbi:unnamed protein product [Blepharisma stoltei]|uniref:PRELI/MSF1 domain-containing protein n=1 Tax=Blepharisma stoltei TaxID=1481888 RepID=A0AAU9J8K9_9CILI|nr:unnamed protein product [Blepharisma stoltei]
MSENTIQLSHTFKQPWCMVARAYLAKYPHRKLSHVESVDTLERYVDEEGRLITTRILASSFMKFSSVFGFERSIIDPHKQSITLLTNNLTHRQFSTSREVCTYSVGENNTTNYVLQSTVIPAIGLGFLVGKLMNVVRGNFTKGTKVLEDIMHTKFNTPIFDSAQSFTEKWNQVSMKKKFKLLKKSVAEIEYFKNIDGSTFNEIVKVLSSHRDDIDVAYKYIKAFSENQCIDKVIDFMTLKDKKVLEDLINAIKRAYEKTMGSELFDQLLVKFRLAELNKL